MVLIYLMRWFDVNWFDLNWFDVKWFRGRFAISYPLYGAAIGGIGAMAYFVIPNLYVPRAPSPLPIWLAEFVVATLWGALAFAPSERRRFGGADAIVVAASIAIRWLAIDHLATMRVLAIFMAAQAVPRATVIALAWASRPAPSGVGYTFSSTLNTWIALVAMAEGCVAAFACGFRPAAMMLAGAYLIARLVRWLSYRYRGGVSADSLGTAQLLTEFFVLLLFDCSACRW